MQQGNLLLICSNKESFCKFPSGLGTKSLAVRTYGKQRRNLRKGRKSGFGAFNISSMDWIGEENAVTMLHNNSPSHDNLNSDRDSTSHSCLMEFRHDLP